MFWKSASLLSSNKIKSKESRTLLEHDEIIDDGSMM